MPKIGRGLNSLWAHMIMNIFKDKAIFFSTRSVIECERQPAQYIYYGGLIGRLYGRGEVDFIYLSFLIGSAGCLADGGQLGNCYKSQNPNVYSAIRAFSGSYYVDRVHDLSFNRVQAAGNISRKSLWVPVAELEDKVLSFNSNRYHLALPELSVTSHCSPRLYRLRCTLTAK